MFRRPILLFTISYAAGIAAQHVAKGRVSLAILCTGVVAAAVLLFLFFERSRRIGGGESAGSRSGESDWQTGEGSGIGAGSRSGESGWKAGEGSGIGAGSRSDESGWQTGDRGIGRPDVEAGRRESESSRWGDNARRNVEEGRRKKDCSGGPEGAAKRALLILTMKRGACLCAAFFVMGLACGYHSEHKVSAFYEAASASDKTTYTLTGRVSSVELKDEEKASLVLTEDASGERILVTVGLSDEAGTSGDETYSTDTGASGAVSEAEALVNMTGKKVTLQGRLSLPKGGTNPGAFDYSLYLRSKKIYTTCYADFQNVSVTDARLHGWHLADNLLARFRYSYEKKVMATLDENEAGMLCGIMFGDDNYMQDETLDSFRHTGIGHLLAVSGLHVGFVFGIVSLLFGRPGTLRGNIPVMLILVLYAALSGFSDSVVRAVFMIGVAIAARVGIRRYDFLSCTAFCAGTLLVYEPAKLFAAGFQMSFMAVFVMSVVLKRFEGIYDKWRERKEKQKKDEYVSLKDDAKMSLKKAAASTLICTAALQLGMSPLTIYHFHYVTPAGIFINPPAIGIAGFIVPLGMLLIAIYPVAGLPIFSLAWTFVAKMTEMLLRLLDGINGGAAESFLGYRYVASPPVAAFVLYYIVLFFVTSESGVAIMRAGFGRRSLSLLLAIAVVTSVGAGEAATWQYQAADLIFIDVGQGDSAHMKTASGLNIVFDTGGSTEFFGSGSSEGKAAGSSSTGGEGSASSGGGTAASSKSAGSSSAVAGSSAGSSAGAKGAARLSQGGAAGETAGADGQGSAASGSTESDSVAEDRLIPYFLGHGISEIDVLVMSHMHQDHAGALPTLARAIKIKKLILSKSYESQTADISADTGIPQKDMIFLKAGETATIGKGRNAVTLGFLTPFSDDGTLAEKSEAEGGDENQMSLVTKATYKGKSVLFTGDIDETYEEELVGTLGEKLDADVLKVAHHGSKYSSCEEFLEAVSPEVSVIQVGTNLYGHPSADAISRLEAAGSTVYRNDTDGAVMLDFDKLNFVVYTMRRLKI